MRYGKLHISLVSHVVLYHCVYQPACIEVLQEKQEIKVLWGNIKVGQFQIANLQATHSLTKHSTDCSPPTPDSTDESY